MAEIASRWIQDGTAETILARKRKERRPATGSRRRRWTGSRSGASRGVSPWLSLPKPWRAESYVEAARRAGVAVTSASAFAVGGRRRRKQCACAWAARAIRTSSRAVARLAALLAGSPEAPVASGP
jgi:DNA-binding transcriptional MocR family regulator